MIKMIKKSEIGYITFIIAMMSYEFDRINDSIIIIYVDDNVYK